MSFSKYVPPRRKKRVFCTKESPFPVPIESITQEPASSDTWFYYTAYLTGKNVIVRHSGDINFLYKMGFFGKGNLSRSMPEFNHRYRTARVPHPADMETIIQPRVQSRRVYKRHVNWSQEDVTDDCISPNCTDSSDSEEDRMDCQPSAVCPVSADNTTQETSTSLHQEDCSNLSETMKKGETGWEEGEAEFWTSANTEERKLDASWDTEADNDFWDVGDSVKKQRVEDPWIAGNGDSDFWNTDEKVCDSIDLTGERGKNNETTMRKSTSSDAKIEVEKSVLSTSVAMDTCVDTNTSEVSNKDIDVPVHSNSSKSNICENEVNETNVACSEDNSEKVKQKCDIHRDDDVAEPDDIDPLCHSDDLDGNILVIDDSDSESRKKGTKRKRKKWKPVLKRDPHPVSEHLQLSLEETFFLSYGLGCLVVVNEEQISDAAQKSMKQHQKPYGHTAIHNGDREYGVIATKMMMSHTESYYESRNLPSSMNLSSLWQRFCTTQTNFLPNYIAYHYYRSKGWVPKTGLKFGCDFIVYKEGPPFYHGSYSVVVRLVDEETLRENPKYANRNMSWISLSGLNRITEHVAKELLICYVIKPSGISEENLLSPACIPQFKVQEILVSRWVSSQERQEKPQEEFP